MGSSLSAARWFAQFVALLLWGQACPPAAAAEPPSITDVSDRLGRPLAIAGEVIEISGANLASEVVQFRHWPLPSASGTTQVTADDFVAPLLSVEPHRLLVQLPVELAGRRRTELRVLHDGLASEPREIELVPLAPAILGANVSIARAGAQLTLRVIGLGIRVNGPAAGFAPTATAPGGLAIPTVAIAGGVPALLVKAELSRVANPQESAGVEEVTISLPSNVGAGETVPVRLLVGHAQSNEFALRIDPPAGVRVTALPSSTELTTADTAQFSATVEGSDDRSVIWREPDTGFAVTAAGSFNGSSYRAPVSVPYPEWIVVQAVHASGAVANALVRVVSAGRRRYRIEPESPSVSQGESLRFTLLDDAGAALPNVTWFREPNHVVLPGGVLTTDEAAGADLLVEASIPGSAAGPVAATRVIVVPPRAEVRVEQSAPLHVGEFVRLAGSGLNKARAVLFPGAGGTRIRVPYQGGAPRIPPGVVSGMLSVELGGDAQAQGPITTSPPVPILIMPHVRLRAPRLRVASGEIVRMAASILNAQEAYRIQWRADFGSIDGEGLYTAPNVDTPRFARIWGCLRGDTECGTAIVQVLPFRLESDYVVLNPRETIRLKAWQGSSEAAVRWQALTANITVDTAGNVTALDGPVNTGKAIIRGTLGTSSPVDFEIFVRGAGATAATAEFHEWIKPVQSFDRYHTYGPACNGPMAARGDWFYVACGSRGQWPMYWMDVYRVDDQGRPDWVESVESPWEAPQLSVEGDTLVAHHFYGLHRYDISRGRPVVIQRENRLFGQYPLETFGPISMRVDPESGDDHRGPLTLHVTNSETGAIRELRLVDFQPRFGRFRATAAGTEEWAAVILEYPYVTADQLREMVIVDLLRDPGAILARLPVSPAAMTSKFATGKVLVAGPDVYRIDGPDVRLTATLPFSRIVAANPSRRLIAIAGSITVPREGFRVVDLADPDHPRWSAPFGSSFQSLRGVALGDSFVAYSGEEGALVAPLAWLPGPMALPVLSWRLDAPILPGALDVKSKDGLTYWATEGLRSGLPGVVLANTPGLFQVMDASGELIASLDRPGDQVAYSVLLRGSFAYVGTDTELIVYDITNPHQPVERIVLPAPALAMTMVGRYLYTASFDRTGQQLLTYDLVDPAVPRLVNTASMPYFSVGIAAQPGWLVAGLGERGIVFYSLENPAAPAQFAYSEALTIDVTVGAPGTPYVYSAAGRQGLQVWDMANPRRPAILTTFPVGASLGQPDLYRIALSVSYDSRGLLWLTTDIGGRVHGVDIRTPWAPRQITELSLAEGEGGVVRRTTSSGNVLYLANPFRSVFEVSAPVNLGVHFVTQPRIGQVLPERSTAQPPFPLVPSLAPAEEHRPAIQRTAGATDRWARFRHRFGLKNPTQ